MNCPRCNAPNENDARFCKICGLPFFQYQAPPVTPANPFVQKPVEDKSLLYMVIIVGLICAESILYLLVEKVVIPLIYGKETYGHGATRIYDVLSWGFNLTTITLSVIFLVKTKSKLVRIVLIAYAALILFNFIQYDLLPLFEKKNDFIYYNF